MKYLILMFFILISMSVSVVAQNTNETNIENINFASEKQQLEEQLKNLYGQFLEAISEGDVETYAELTTNKYVFTRGNHAEILTKLQRLEQLQREAKFIESFNIASATFSTYKNSAIGNFDLEEKDVFQGTQYNHLFRVTVSYVKTIDKGWKIAAVHSTPVSRQ